MVGQPHFVPGFIPGLKIAFQIADDPLRAAAERFGSKMEALREARQAVIVPIPSRQSQT